ncbi:hypothetical protein [Lentzea sp.]|uniref:hypothetical protein n=1 Tax=Lentzea sp. TaxID=56099 RepID=UPI002C92D6F2|nr:hypothetical protein [Lentzea sp.]HUQ59019.1 hypothetical protein [Lentzea sp.]
MTTTPYNGALHPRRRCSGSGTGVVLLAALTFAFAGGMMAYGHPPVTAVATASALLAVITTLGRSRPFSARFGPLPLTGSAVVWEDERR